MTREIERLLKVLMRRVEVRKNFSLLSEQKKDLVFDMLMTMFDGSKQLSTIENVVNSFID